MAPPNVSPGPDAASAFRLGVVTAAVAACLVVGASTAAGALTPLEAALLSVICLPAYLVFAAAALSVWLGYDKDATDLRPVEPNRERTGPR